MREDHCPFVGHVNGEVGRPTRIRRLFLPALTRSPSEVAPLVLSSLVPRFLVDKNELLESYLNSDPIIQFQHWFDQALDQGVMEPNATTLSTRTAKGVDSRIVLLKGVEDNSFVFYTNYNSHKSQQLLSDGHCTLLFLWLEQQRQVIVRGVASKHSEAASDAYFANRPRGSQIGAWVSNQSLPVDSREVLEQRLAELTALYERNP